MKDVWARASPSVNAGDPRRRGSRTNKRNRYRKHTIEFYRWSLFTCLNDGRSREAHCESFRFDAINSSFANSIGNLAAPLIGAERNLERIDRQTKRAILSRNASGCSANHRVIIFDLSSLVIERSPEITNGRKSSPRARARELIEAVRFPLDDVGVAPSGTTDEDKMARIIVQSQELPSRNNGCRI